MPGKKSSEGDNQVKKNERTRSKGQGRKSQGMTGNQGCDQDGLCDFIALADGRVPGGTTFPADMVLQNMVRYVCMYARSKKDAIRLVMNWQTGHLPLLTRLGRFLPSSSPMSLIEGVTSGF